MIWLQFNLLSKRIKSFSAFWPRVNLEREQNYDEAGDGVEVLLSLQFTRGQKVGTLLVGWAKNSRDEDYTYSKLVVC